MSLAELLEQIIGHGVNIELTMTITLADVKIERESFRVECECGWNSSYSAKVSSERGLRTHQQHCPLHNQPDNVDYDKLSIAPDEQDVDEEFPWINQQ